MRQNYLTEEPDFKGYIHDVGGPTANFRFPACEKQLTIRSLSWINSACSLKPCKNLHRGPHVIISHS